MYGLAGEGVVVELGAEEFIAIKSQAAGGSRVTGRTGKRKQDDFAERDEPRGGFVRARDRERRRHEVRIAAQVAVGNWIVPAEIAVVSAEPVAPVIADAAVFGAACFGIN